MAEWIPFVMFLTVCLVLMAGYPVAFSLAGTALIFAFFGLKTTNTRLLLDKFVLF